MSLKSEAARSVRPRIIEEVPRPRATDLAVRLAEQVRRLRIQAGLTQAELAARAGVTVETIARLERVLRGRLSANANPSLETMERIGTALGVEVAELLAAPAKQKTKDDRLVSVLRGVSPATRRRVIRVAEALVRDDRADARPITRKR
ncbi:MAG TPA: helix-turn-helix transcriptional regulator [Polyangiaceae bacterium]|nr:helix-turn-helix transcriptional regulator [Polyangiaceae bacterium]